MEKARLIYIENVIPNTATRDNPPARDVAIGISYKGVDYIMKKDNFMENITNVEKTKSDIQEIVDILNKDLKE